jgi:hypothetical protein
MKVVNLAIGGILCGSLFAATALAQNSPSAELRQPSSVQRTSYESSYVYFDPQTGTEPAADAKKDDEKKDEAKPEEEAKPEPWTMPQPKVLKDHGITVGGWIDAGINSADVYTGDRWDGVDGYADRNREFGMDQLNVFLKKDVKTDGCGTDWGGRIDMMYGTDARYPQSAGLERTWDQNGVYQLALPQFYFDVAVNDWTVRVGHFYTILGYEVVTAPDNFFYTRDYSNMYGEPFTHTGVNVLKKVNDQLSYSVGAVRSTSNNVDSFTGEKLGILSGVTWKSKNEKLTVNFGFVDEQDDVLLTDELICSGNAAYKVNDKLNYVIQSDYGEEQAAPGSVGEARWYSLVNYLFYTLNDHWTAGVRYEVFRDNNGTRVSGLGIPGLGDNPHTGPYVGNFNELTCGLNWKPNLNVTVRPEIRWDWFDGTTAAGSQEPFVGSRDQQFSVAIDGIFTF